MNTKALLVILVIAGVGILGIMIYESQQDTPAEQLADSVSDVANEVSDEVDDATTN